jgi:hypothetical protein
MNDVGLEILEVNYAVSPGGEDEFEVYSLDSRDNFSPPIFTSTNLLEAVQYCYQLGKDFTVRTFAQWEERELANVQ